MYVRPYSLLEAVAAPFLAVLICCPLSSNRASAFASGVVSASPGPEANESPTITVQEAGELIDLLPVTKELRAKGMVVKWDVQTGASMNDKDYYFFWIYNVTAQKERDIGSISVGNYAVNKHTADVRAWQVSHDVSYGDDGVLVTTNELERLQEELRKRQGIDSLAIQRYRSAHLAKRIIPREAAQSAVHLPIMERSKETAEVSCWKDSAHPISRLGRSSIVTSSTGYRAYAEVNAVAFRPKYQETYSGPLCENSVKLFLANAGESSFQILLDSSLPKNDCITVEGGDSCDVNGIQLVDWSKDGRFLLADLVLWVYESDALVMRVPIIYDVTKSEFVRPDVYHFFDEYYKTSFFKEKSEPTALRCEFELRSEGFSPDSNIIVSASRPPDDPSFEQEFCLDKKQTFLFDLKTNKINRLPSSYKAQHYGTWNSGGVPKP
jgi:hypothetical protein